jgi:hypothetical protein
MAQSVNIIGCYGPMNLASHVTGEGLSFDIMSNKYLRKKVPLVDSHCLGSWERHTETKIGILRGSET